MQVLPYDTRWNSQLKCMENYLKNHVKYLEISRREEFVFAPHILFILNDMQLFQEIQRLTKLLKPVSEYLDKLQSDKATVADAVDCWIKLRYEHKLVSAEIGDDDLGDYFLEQFQVGTPSCAIAAYMIHPKYQGRIQF